MSSPGSAYWRERFEALEASGHRQAEETWSVIEQGYRDAQRQMESDIARWYQRVAKNNSVTVSEAKRILSTKELKEFRWTLDEYIRKGQEMNLTGAWMKELENASARFHITRLEALQLQLQNTVEVLYGGTLDALDSRLKEAYLDSYYHTAYEIQRGVGVGWDIAAINSRALQTVISNPWTTDGKTFSDRLWTQKAELVSTLQRSLTSALMQGKPPDGVADLLVKKFGVSQYQAERLVYTEHAFFRSVAQGESYKALGVKEYEFIATLDERTSDECREHDGNVYKMDDYAPGETAPPLHPWCRSTTAPHFSGMADVGERAARNQDTGKTYYVPRSMKYEEWEKTFAAGGSKAGLQIASASGIVTGAAACKTVSDVEDYMRQKGWFRVGTINQNQRISLAGCDLEAAQEVAQAYERVFARYPQMIGKIDAVSCKPLGSNTYAQCFTKGGGAVDINARFFADHIALQASYARDVAAGYHPVNTDWRSIVVHEIGHAVDGTLTNLGLGGRKLGGGYKDVSASLRPKVMRACGLKVYDAGRAVSGYATKDNREWFAEAFAEMMDSPMPRPVAKELGRRLDEIMKKVK